MVTEVAERYAQGLFELAKENATVTEKKENAETLKKVLELNPEIRTFLRAVKVTGEEKKNFVETVFKDALDGDFIRFIKLLIDKGRVMYLDQIVTEYIRLTNEYLGIEHGTVLSARPLKAEDLEPIRAALEKKTGKQIILENKVNPDLIAGIKVTVGNNVTDVTMKNKIDSMKEQLMKGGQA
jgi:F-type H+-transporting ATPase subunit delta